LRVFKRCFQLFLLLKEERKRAATLLTHRHIFSFFLLPTTTTGEKQNVVVFVKPLFNEQEAPSFKFFPFLSLFSTFCLFLPLHMLECV
jgi:hypothetical protein